MSKTTEIKQNLKLTILKASPSHGWNSDSMLEAFLEGIDSVEGDMTYTTYPVASLVCDHHCFDNRRGAQDHEPDLKRLLEDIESSQGLVIATPTYNFNVPAGLKNAIDRLSTSIALDYQKINFLKQPTGKLNYLRNFYLVSGGTPKITQTFLFALFPPFWLSVIFYYFGVRRQKSIYGGSLQGGHLAKDDKKLMQKCRKAGVIYAKQIIKENK